MAETPGLVAPDPSKTYNPDGSVLDQTDANAAVAVKVAAQDNLASTLGPTIEDKSRTSDALDKLLIEKQKPANKTEGDEPEVDPTPVPDDKDKAKSKPTGETDVDHPIDPQPDPEAEAKKAADQKLVDDIFKDSPQLPPGASAKSHEAFAHVKIKAARDISDANKKAEEALARVKELEEKTKGPMAPEIEAELKELREFRTKLDIDADPRFKANVKKIESAHEFIYAQLLKSDAVDQSHIDKIKKLGGPENVNLGKLFESINDPVIQRLVDSKIAEIETIKYEQDKARETAKANVSQYLQERAEAYKSGATAHNQQTTSFLKELHGATDWMKPPQLKADATPEQKADAEKHSAFVKQVQSEMQQALQDDSPQMRAILIQGMGNLFYVQKQLEGATAKLESSEKVIASKDAEIAKLNETIVKMKNVGANRIREQGGARQDGKPAQPAATTTSTTARPGDALDAIRDRVMQERANAGR